MVKREFTFPSADGKTAIHAVEWLPEGAPEPSCKSPTAFRNTCCGTRTSPGI